MEPQYFVNGYFFRKTFVFVNIRDPQQCKRVKRRYEVLKYSYEMTLPM